ncbi:polymorphic toxin type 44 domain-containing protein [Pseudomonas sp. Pseusp16]|uniref:polymorphic toxin type 44 domain-containing protein n=1 Tax=Pseudomonas sp. Pseusp16 TaxID=3243021 RepID=UPI0039B6184E
MGRGTANGLGQGLHGDLTTTGAMCISSLPCATHGGRAVLRLGDKTTACKKCGRTGVIVDSLPAMKWHGVPTVLDGAEVHCGCPPGTNRLIAPAPSPRATRSEHTQSVAHPTRHSDQVSTTKSLQSDQKTVEIKTRPVVCNDPDMMEEVASYIAGEMNRNITHPSVVKMKNLNNFDADGEQKKFRKLPWYARLSPPNFKAIESGNRVTAMALWAERVGQNRPWDHKVTIGLQFGGPWQKQGMFDYFYDIWSNVHYGYVGMAGGLSESLLLDGAGVEQIASDSIRKIQKWDKRPGPRRSTDIEGMRAWDDIGDRVSISIGIKLYRLQPNGGITVKMLMDEVLGLPRTSWGDGIRDHICK